MSKEIPLLVFLPILICALSILFLLEIYKKKTQEQREQNERFEEQLREELQQHQMDSDDNDSSDNDHAEGTLLRQYREYMDQQIKERKAQDEVFEELFKRKQWEESIRRTDELEKMRKEKVKKAKQEEKENLKKQKVDEKNAKLRESKYNKYHPKIKKWIKENKFCQIEDLAKIIGLSSEDVEYILKQLCQRDSEFELKTTMNSLEEI
ncbi:unnamed protein product [Rhizopus stolonifer]